MYYNIYIVFLVKLAHSFFIVMVYFLTELFSCRCNLSLLNVLAILHIATDVCACGPSVCLCVCLSHSAPC